MMDAREILANSINAAENAAQNAWEIWSKSLDSLSRTQDQIDDAIKSQVDRNRASRQELTKLLLELTRQQRDTQSEVQKMYADAYLSNYDVVAEANQNLAANIPSNIADMTKKPDKKATA